MVLELIKETSVNGIDWYIVRKDGKIVSFDLTLNQADRSFNYLLERAKKEPVTEILKSITI